MSERALLGEISLDAEKALPPQQMLRQVQKHPLRRPQGLEGRGYVKLFLPRTCLLCLKCRAWHLRLFSIHFYFLAFLLSEFDLDWVILMGLAQR